MCLDPKRDTGQYGEQPYNKSNIRWKALDIEYRDSKTPRLSSPTCNANWEFGKEKTARDAGGAYGPHDIGFHVLTSKSAAARYTAGDTTLVIVKLEVDKFVAAGVYYDDKCETWKKAKIVEVWSSSGRYNITDRFIK